MNWIVATFISLFSFGLWGFFTKLTILHIDSRSALIYQTIGVILVSLTLWSYAPIKLEIDQRGIGFAVLTGIAYAAGCLFYFMAASRGKIIPVVTLTALYPVITLVLAYGILGETINAKQCIGMLLALLAIILMST